MRYILRVVVHENQWERQMQDVIRFCHYAHIEEVFVKEQCHQILMSPVPMEKHRRMSRIYKQFAKGLREKGIIFSINIATIVGHCDAELAPEQQLPFSHFVGADLKERQSNFCIMDPEWQQYAQEMVSLYAASKPARLMIDDDFRSLNHSGYLGCFCPLHVQAVSKQTGRQLTAESILRHVTGNSEEDQQIRKVWMQVNFDAQLQAAEKIRDAVHRVSPDTIVGLMNSGEQNHSVQGRKIEQLIAAFAGDKKGLSRPLGGAYSDALHEELIGAVQGMALSMEQLSNVEIVSEVENWPHTRYTKSIRQTRLQMQLHAMAGADAISMNIFDFMGTPYEQEPEMMQMIREARRELDEIARLRRAKRPEGVGVLWHPEAALHKWNYGNTPEEIVPDRTADTLLPLLGIPVCFHESEVNYLTQDVAACLSDDDLRRLLKRGLILDAGAADVLDRRGFSDLIGCRVDGKVQEVSAEILEDGDFCGRFKGNMLPTNLLRLHLKGEDMPMLVPAKSAHVLTAIVDQDYHWIANGVTLFENRLGGRVCVIPTNVSVWTWAYRSRAYLLRRIVNWLSQGRIPTQLSEGVNVAPFYYKDRQTGEQMLALLNTGLDEERVSVNVEGIALDKDGVPVLLDGLLLPALSLQYYIIK